MKSNNPARAPDTLAVRATCPEGVDHAEERQNPAERLTATLDSLADGFILLDAGWRIRYVNPEGAKIVRRQRAGMLGRHLWEEFPEARGSRFESEYRRAMDERVTVDFAEFFAPLDLWCRVRAWPSADGIAISFVDITAQKRAEEQLLRLNAELEERVRQRTQDLAATTRELEVLSYAIAHDLRAPLAALDGFGRALEEAEGSALSSRGRGYLRRIRAATQRMDEMTDGLLALGRISGQPAEWTTLDLATLAADAWRTVSSQDAARRVSIRIAPRLGARGQRAQVQLVLQNLLGNAWKFTAGADDPFVEVGSAGEEDGQRVFFVGDNGAGFDPAHAHRLFKPFHRLHAADEFPGTGLGLAVVHKVVQLHGGRVWAQAGPDGGATFFFTLPKPEPANGAQRAEATAAGTGSRL
jgi:PAS domain S-box-containing protein